jgi:hypothetical protein
VYIALMQTSKLLYSRKEAAQLLSLSLRSVDHLISSKKLQTRNIGKRVLVIGDSLSGYASIIDVEEQGASPKNPQCTPS